MLNVTAVSGTSPSLRVWVQQELPSGEWDDLAAFRVITAVQKTMLMVRATAPVEQHDPLDGELLPGSVQYGPINGSGLRVKWVISGTNPSFTFAVKVDLWTISLPRV
jgi:hypothetical protein